MENNHDFTNSPDIITMLEQLKHDIESDIEWRKGAYTYIGKDGKYYYDKKSLDLANKAYIESMYKFIGKDGRQYSTPEELRAANRIYEEEIFPKIEKQDFYDNNEIIHKSK